MGITDTEPYNNKFEWLGYGSRNIIDNMGSILILILLLAIYGLTILVVNATHIKHKQKDTNTK